MDLSCYPFNALLSTANLKVYQWGILLLCGKGDEKLTPHSFLCPTLTRKIPGQNSKTSTSNKGENSARPGLKSSDNIRCDWMIP